MDELRSNATINRGKRMRLNGEPIPPYPERLKFSQSWWDLRCGWHLADCNLADHPDWTPEQIMA